MLCIERHQDYSMTLGNKEAKVNPISPILHTKQHNIIKSKKCLKNLEMNQFGTRRCLIDNELRMKYLILFKPLFGNNL